MPRISPFPQKLVQTNNLFVILDEGNVHSYRQVFLDGRGHAKGLDQLWMGHSIGTWADNNTLVVDSVGFNERFWFERQGALDAIAQYPDNILFESDYPHPTCQHPGPRTPGQRPRDYAQELLGGLPDDVVRKVLHDNAAAVYGVK